MDILKKKTENKYFRPSTDKSREVLESWNQIKKMIKTQMINRVNMKNTS